MQDAFWAGLGYTIIFGLFVGGVTLSSIFGGRTWFFILLTLVVIMSSIMLILLSKHAWKYNLKGTASLYLIYLLLTLVLNGMARTPSPSISVEWIKQLLNTAAAIILMIASWQLWRSISIPKNS